MSASSASPIGRVELTIRYVSYPKLAPKGTRCGTSDRSAAREIEIVGYRGAVLLSNGQTMVEEPTIGKQRAEQVSMLLQGASLKEPTFTVKLG